jgi:transposase
MLRAIAASKKRNDRIDAGKIADCLRCDFHPNANGIHRDSGSASHAAVSASDRAPNGSDEDRVSGLLLETGATHNKQRLHRVG